MAPDIVHAHQESFVKMLRLLPLPRVHTVHNTGIQLTTARKHFHALYAISEAVRDDLVRRYADAHPVLILNGIPCSNFVPKLSYGNKPFRIVQVSRLDHAQKGQDILLNALVRVIKTIGPAAVTVDFIGTGPSNEFLLKLAQELGVNKLCQFRGQRTRDEIYQELHTYDLLVQPSRFEGFGLTVAEAMAARVPVLVSDAEGPMESIGGGRYGYHFRSEDADDCAARILEIIEVSGTGGFSNMQTRNAEYAKGRFDISRTARKYLEEYGKLCGR
jgi:glycosyltransferase involved in cell wall biosynthesis